VPISFATSRERMLAAIRCEEVDHIPLGQIFHSTVLGTPREKQWTNQFERAKIMKEMGIDPVIDIWLPVPEPPDDIPVRRWTEDEGRGPLLCAEYHTPAGTLVQKVRKTSDWYDKTHYRFLPTWDGNAHRTPDSFDQIDLMDDFFTRRYKVPLVKGPEHLDALACLLKAPRGAKRDEWIRNARRAKSIADELGLLTHARRLAVGDWFMWLCLIEDFCIAMVEQPEYVSGFYDICQAYNLEVLEMVLEVAPDVIQYRGWYDTPDYWGRDRLGTILMPRIQQLADAVHSGGSLFCYLLPEGYTLYRNELSELDVDVFLGLEPFAARKSEDLALVKAAFADKSAIWGGVNAPITVGMGSDEEIEEAVRTAVDALGPRGLILNASMYIYDDDVRWDRFMVFVDAWRKYANV